MSPIYKSDGLDKISHFFLILSGLRAQNVIWYSMIRSDYQQNINFAVEYQF